MTSTNENTDPIRFIDLLTGASAVAAHLQLEVVDAQAMLHALDIARGEINPDELGPGVHPFVARPSTGVDVDPLVRGFVQGWYERLGGSSDACLDAESTVPFAEELRALLPD